MVRPVGGQRRGCPETSSVGTRPKRRTRLLTDVGIFDVIRSTKQTLWLGLALAGFYLIAAAVSATLEWDHQRLGLLFLVLLAGYGFMAATRWVAVAVGATISLLAALIWAQRPDAVPGIEADASAIMATTLAVSPFLAVAMGSLVRVVVSHRARPDARAQTPPPT